MFDKWKTYITNPTMTALFHLVTNDKLHYLSEDLYVSLNLFNC